MNRTSTVLALLVLAAPLAARQGFVPCQRVLHVLEGEATGDWFGFVSAPIPDVDGDGVNEFLVGAPLHDTGGSNAGRIYLYDGRTGLERFHADGGAAGERLGWSVRHAGDVDGDGVSDVIGGGYGTTTTQGAAVVLSGATGALIWTLQLGAAGDYFGFGACGIGDVDGDGTDDVAVSATRDDGAGVDAGRVYVVSGADGATVLRSLLGEKAGDNFGTSVASLGDVTGDGLPELAVGAADAGPTGLGRAYVFDLAAQTLLYSVDPDAGGIDLGLYYIASAGELDGDGWPDLYVEDYGDHSGRGKAYFFSGPTGARIMTLSGGAGDGFGVGRPLGDVNGDGRTDLVLGSYTDSTGGGSAGKAGVYSGADGSLLREIVSTTAQEQFGFDAHGLGDVDGDGQPEMVVTAANFASRRGRAYVLAAEPLATFGSGLAGSGGFVPALALGGCPRLGQGIAYEVSQGLGGALGALLIGATRVDLPFHGGILHPDPQSSFRVAHRLGGATGVPGAGTASLAFTLPNDPALVGLTFTSQAVYADRGAPAGLSLTNGLSLQPYP